MAVAEPGATKMASSGTYWELVALDPSQPDPAVAIQTLRTASAGEAAAFLTRVAGFPHIRVQRTYVHQSPIYNEEGQSIGSILVLATELIRER